MVGEPGKRNSHRFLAGRDVSDLHLGVEAALAQDLLEQLARLVVGRTTLPVEELDGHEMQVTRGEPAGG